MATSRKYRQRPEEVEAVQLRWETWNEVCEMIGPFWIGMRGVYVDADGNWHDQQPATADPRSEARIGLLIPCADGYVLAVQDDYVVRTVTGTIDVCKAHNFRRRYTRIVERAEDQS